MTLQETINKISNIQPLMRDLSRYVKVRVAADLLAQVKQRVQLRGINANNAPFRPYSTRPSLLGYSDYPLNKKAYTRLKSQAKKVNKVVDGGYYSWVSIYNAKKKKYVPLIVVPGGYKEIRNAAGYQIMHKDFTVKNDMWRSVKVISVNTSGTEITFAYGATNAKEAEKINGHNKREGINILEPTKKELETVQVEMVNFLEDAINVMFNGR